MATSKSSAWDPPLPHSTTTIFIKFTFSFICCISIFVFSSTVAAFQFISKLQSSKSSNIKVLGFSAVIIDQCIDQCTGWLICWQCTCYSWDWFQRGRPECTTRSFVFYNRLKWYFYSKDNGNPYWFWKKPWPETVDTRSDWLSKIIMLIQTIPETPKSGKDSMIIWKDYEFWGILEERVIN